MRIDGSPTASRRPWPTIPATATSTSGWPTACTARMDDRSGCDSPVAWLVTTCFTSLVTGCALTGSAMASSGRLRSDCVGRAGMGTRASLKCSSSAPPLP